MPIITIRCMNCHGTLQLDASKDSDFCYYCGSPIVLGEEIAKHVTPIESTDEPAGPELSYHDLLERAKGSFRRLEQAGAGVPKEYRSVKYFYLLDGPLARRFLFDLHRILFLDGDDAGAKALNERYEAFKVQLRVEQQDAVNSSIRAVWTLVVVLAALAGALLLDLLTKNF